ncbi:MAG: hypothetical protein LHV69_11770, partial [Elusimicrobia bacterium]|nr:hypothetical protein [Candidatus Obscuribacterium magneticum]
MMRKIMDGHRRLTYILLSITITVIGLEVLARLFFAFDSRGFEKTRKVMVGEILADQPLQRVIDQAYLLYIPTPNYRPAGHNAHGYRGKIVPLERAPRVKRVLCLGGSTTYGWGVDDANKTYPALLEELINAEGDKRRKVEVINAGVP